MSLEKIRKAREKIHNFAKREHDLHAPLNNLVRSVEKLFSDEKEIEDAKTYAKHAKDRAEFVEQAKRYKKAKKSESQNKKDIKKAYRKFYEKWKKLKKASRF